MDNFSEDWSWISSNSSTPCQPLTAETFKKNCDQMLAAYKNGTYQIQPDMFKHFTPCCERFYETMSTCVDYCPYNCGKKWSAINFCESCLAVAKSFLDCSPVKSAELYWKMKARE